MRRPNARRGAGQAGQASAEYLGVLALVVAVAAALVLAAPGVGQAVLATAKHALCRVGGDTNCGSSVVAAGGQGASAADRAAQQRATIAAIQKAWMADQAQYQYVHGRPTPEWVAYKKYSSECWYTKASCYAAAVLSLGGSLEDAKRMWALHCGPTPEQQEGCDSGAVVRDHLTEMILIDIPATLAAGGIVKFIGERAVFSIGEVVVEEGATGPASSAANAARLAQQLAREEAGAEAASIFTDAGTLRSEIIAASDEIIAGEELGNPELIKALTADGSNIQDWGKYATETFNSPSGPFKVHFYYNPVTKAVNYDFDFKVVFNTPR